MKSFKNIVLYLHYLVVIQKRYALLSISLLLITKSQVNWELTTDK